ncbi:MAG: DUF1761 domain-containing protein [candidate division KSB1 bacterium]|nr:DUF1761 domain-containing protein [candidate division KSB1 bacterium]MDZ7274487.1 DUF1761 domain-containing protein [candidate division KSB1 bacterium]MDZ7284851.1 DUF1761 domain-containing protein [candidate division KSB1 bacterium]MDZ7297729.1 DUF1761 domain-containing protein [candidate division KSB1 bacterium]MDZ7307596.1 DUF1761 domain-containing protein [candidate division KSB1 bacterium]
MPTSPVAVLVAALVYFVLGGLWYSPLMFARPWMALVGISEEQIRQKGGAGKAYAVAVLCSLIIAFVLAILVNQQTPANLFTGAQTGLMTGVGLVAMTAFTTSTFEARPLKLFLIDAGYNVVGFILAGAILGAWR